MSLPPFQPAGELSYAEQLYQHIRDFPTGRVISHDEDGLPFLLNEKSSAVASVCKRMEREQKRTLVSIKGVGYKLVAGAEHVQAAAHRRRCASKAMRRAHKCVLAVDRREMSAVDQIEHDGELFRLQMLSSVVEATRGRTTPEQLLAKT